VRVAINAVAVDGGGSQTYLLSILKPLCAMAVNHEFLVIISSRQDSLLASLPSRVQGVVCRGVPRQAWLRIMWEQTVLPVLLWQWRIDLLYAAFNTAVLLSPVPVVLLSHNCAPYSLLPLPWSMYGHARHAMLRLLGRLSARVARTVVFVSNSSARVMAPQMGVPVSRTRVVHHGWCPVQHSEVRECRPPLTLPKQYLLTVADLYPHKNLEILMEAFQHLVGSGKYSGDLVIAGATKKSAGGYARRLLALRDNLPCRDRIHFVGGIPHSWLCRVYRAADLFVFPSLMETFAFPLVEAMAAGVPIVASDWRLMPGGEMDRINVAPEICADAAEYFNPLERLSLVDTMERVLANPQRQEELIQRGRVRAQNFTWEKSARELLRNLEDAVACRGTRG